MTGLSISSRNKILSGGKIVTDNLAVIIFNSLKIFPHHSSHVWDIFIYDDFVSFSLSQIGYFGISSFIAPVTGILLRKFKNSSRLRINYNKISAVY